MLIPLQRLVDRVRQVPSRAEDLHRVRRQVAAAARERPGPEERALARELRARREALSARLAEVRSCASCAREMPRPEGAFEGGACCGGHTTRLFSDDEVAALAQAGTRVRHLRAPRTEHAGCAFRGPTGCTLTPAHRPNLCVRYLCNGLCRELHADDRLDEIESMVEGLYETFQRFVAVRAERRLREELAALGAPDPVG